MSSNLHVKTIQGLKYYTGSHPEMMLVKKKSGRPTEFGHKVWASTLVLIDYFSKNSFDFYNKQVLEVGCGWGILGLYLAKNFQAEVLLTDIDAKVLPNVKSHAALNKLNVETKALGFTDISSHELLNIDVIVGVEVCYSQEATIDLFKLFDKAFVNNVSDIFIADPGRPDFIDLAESQIRGYNKSIHKLAGTINGKITNLLHLYK